VGSDRENGLEKGKLPASLVDSNISGEWGRGGEGSGKVTFVGSIYRFGMGFGEAGRAGLAGLRLGLSETVLH